MAAETTISVRAMLDTAIFSRIRTAAAPLCRRQPRQYRGDVCHRRRADPQLRRRGDRLYPRQQRPHRRCRPPSNSTALMLAKDLTDGIITDIPDRRQGTGLFHCALHQHRRQVGRDQRDLHARTRAGFDHPGHRIRQRDTDFMRVAGFPNLNFNTSSTSPGAIPGCGWRWCWITRDRWPRTARWRRMQTAAKDMIDTLSAYNKKTGDVYISIIPFAKDVNVGTAECRRVVDQLDGLGGRAPVPRWQQVQQFQQRHIAGSNCPFIEHNSRLYLHGPAGNVERSPCTKSTYLRAATYSGYICPSVDSGNKLPGKTGIYYNGCYTTVTGSSASCGSSTALHVHGQAARAKYVTFGVATVRRRRPRRPLHAAPGLAVSTIAISPLRDQRRTRAQPPLELLRRAVVRLPSRHSDADEQSVANPQGSDHRHDSQRQHQPGGRAGMGMAVREHDEWANRGASERRQLHLQGLHRPAVRRSEHPKPLEHNPVVD